MMNLVGNPRDQLPRIMAHLFSTYLESLSECLSECLSLSASFFSRRILPSSVGLGLTFFGESGIQVNKLNI